MREKRKMGKETDIILGNTVQQRHQAKEIVFSQSGAIGFNMIDLLQPWIFLPRRMKARSLSLDFSPGIPRKLKMTEVSMT